MAKKYIPPPPPETKIFTLQEIDAAVRKLRRRVEELKALAEQKIRYDDAAVKNAETNIRETVREIFGGNSPEFRDHEHHDIWKGGYNMMDDAYTRQAKFMSGIPNSIGLMEGLIARLEEKRLDLAEAAAPAAGEQMAATTPTRRVFVVHGHDIEAKLAVSGFLKQLKLEPIILSEHPNEGRTIIEKFEHHANVSYAVVLLTPDDMGHESGSQTPRPRARQNVILELGYFIGRLGRPNVCALHKGNIEIPTDYHGVLYVPLDAGDSWKLKLAKEMKAAGLEVDLNLAM